MAARYELWLCNEDGTRIADQQGHTMLERVISFTATRIANDIGTFIAQLPPTFDTNLLRRDNIIQVWRAAEGAALKLFRPYFLRHWEFRRRRKKTTIELIGRCPNDLLRRRQIRAAPGTYGASFGNDYIDNLMKLAATRMQSDAAGYGWPAPNYGSRDWPDLSVEGDASAGPYKTPALDGSYEPVLETGGYGILGELADYAQAAGQTVYFDIVPLILTPQRMTLIFRTQVDQPGMDLTGQGILFSEERGNLKDHRLTFDYTEEVNMLWDVNEKGPYDTGVVQHNAEAAMDASKWNRCEGSANIAAADGRAWLADHAGIQSFNGEVIDVRGMRFGKHWNWGDRALVRAFGFQFEAVIEAVTLQVTRRGETVAARIKYQTEA